uniref:Uncharacterized protein n=2 Tax=Meloidogyne TaxID=189290 RepID=A0A6V7V9A1_MELEN|nr:unnamed protein product [Meloidogyne enterolobii]
MIRRFIFHQVYKIFNFFWRQLFRWINFKQFAQLLGNFILVLSFSLITPAVLRPVFATSFTELRQPLEFTFKTCMIELAGVCSFPEAEFWVEEAGMRLHPYYYYSFVLDLILYDTQQNRALSLMIGNIQLKNGQNKLLANFHKSVPVFKAFPGRSIFSHFYTLTRNTVFWPLWIIGYFSTTSDVSEQLTVHFPNYYMEKPDDQATKQIIVQLQNKFIQAL